MPPMSSYFPMKYFEKFARFFNLSRLPTAFPLRLPQQAAEQIAVSGIKRSVFDEWCQISLYSDQECISALQERDKRGKSENFPITGWQRWYSRAKRMARFCLLIYLWHEIAWNDRSCLVDLFSNANMELGVPATGPVRMIWRIKGIF